MQNKKAIGCFLFAFGTIAGAVAFVALIFLGTKNIINMGLGFSGAMGIGLIWLCITAKISKKQQDEIPVIQSNAVLIEKIQEDHQQSSNYFLIFELDDGSKKVFFVKIDVFASVSKNEKGLLKYKKTSSKEHLISYKFLSFEKEK